jgi:hypothetical protein
MTGNVALDVVIGLVFIYSLYSLFVTTIVEFLASLFSWRSRKLNAAIQRMLDDDTGKGYADTFYNQPLIKYLGEKNSKVKKWLKIPNHPSYLQARNFSMAVIQMLHGDKDSGEFNIAKLRNELETGTYKDTQTAKYLLSLLNNSQESLEKFKSHLESWFDDTMERTSGWYKRKATYISLAVGVIMAMLFNVDSIQIVKQLSKDPKARAQLVELASHLSSDTTLISDSLRQKVLSTQLVKLQSLSDTSMQILSISRDPEKAFLPLNFYVKVEKRTTELAGIKKHNCFTWCLLQIEKFTGFLFNLWFDDFSNFIGCLITAVALSLGAPFWFDLLNKLVQLKSSISPKKSDSSPDLKQKEPLPQPATIEEPS